MPRTKGVSRPKVSARKTYRKLVRKESTSTEKVHLTSTIERKFFVRVQNLSFLPRLHNFFQSVNSNVSFIKWIRNWIRFFHQESVRKLPKVFEKFHAMVYILIFQNCCIRQLIYTISHPVLYCKYSKKLFTS